MAGVVFPIITYSILPRPVFFLGSFKPFVSSSLRTCGHKTECTPELNQNEYQFFFEYFPPTNHYIPQYKFRHLGSYQSKMVLYTTLPRRSLLIDLWLYWEGNYWRPRRSPPSYMKYIKNDFFLPSNSMWYLRKYFTWLWTLSKPWYSDFIYILQEICK